MKLFRDICEEAEHYRKDMTALKALWKWVKEHKRNLSESHYGFIKWFIRDIELTYKEQQEQTNVKKQFEDNDDAN